MRQSRYIWIILISGLCMIGMVFWSGPEKVWSALADGSYGNQSVAVVQRFWQALDLRQTSLAQAMTAEDNAADQELDYWTDLVNRDPLIKLQKTEFIEVETPESLMVRVVWSDGMGETYSFSYAFVMRETEQGWKIQSINKVNDLSFVGGVRDERLSTV